MDSIGSSGDAIVVHFLKWNNQNVAQITKRTKKLYA